MNARCWTLAWLSLLGAVPCAAQGPERDVGGGNLWQITLKDGTFIWNLHLERLQGDTIVFREGSATARYPLLQVDELRLVRGALREIGPIGDRGRYEGAANGASDVVYQLTLLDLPERREVVERILRLERAESPP